MCVTGWIGIAYSLRTQVIIIRDREYNLASKCLGSSTVRIAVKNILPFMISFIVTIMATQIPAYIASEAFLSYIGLGISDTTLGKILYNAQSAMVTPGWGWEFWCPVMLSAFISVVLFLIGQNLGDAADPRDAYVRWAMEDRNVLLSIRNLWVKFHVRGRVLTAIRDVSLDIYEDESIAIVGESGCGKSVLTKTFAGMLDNNGFIDKGDIFFNDPDLTVTAVAENSYTKPLIARYEAKLNEMSRTELGAATWREILALEKDHKERLSLNEAEAEVFAAEWRELVYRRTEANNQKQALDRKREKAGIKALEEEIKGIEARMKDCDRRREAAIAEHKRKTQADTAYLREYESSLAALKSRYAAECAGEVTPELRERNSRLAREVYLSLNRYPRRRQLKLRNKLLKAIGEAMKIGEDLTDDAVLNRVFENAVFRVKYLGTDEGGIMRGERTLNLARADCVSDWTKIRGQKIATIFQDPMTSLNPIMTIGRQITSVIMKHQNVSEVEARRRAIVLMKKVGIRTRRTASTTTPSSTPAACASA